VFVAARFAISRRHWRSTAGSNRFYLRVGRLPMIHASMSNG
jgi:hypothetical protein